MQEQKDAYEDKSQLTLSKLIEPDGHHFYYKYKNMSMASKNLYKANKAPEQAREDKAVQVFFRKQLAQMTH